MARTIGCEGRHLNIRIERAAMGSCESRIASSVDNEEVTFRLGGLDSHRRRLLRHFLPSGGSRRLCGGRRQLSRLRSGCRPMVIVHDGPHEDLCASCQLISVLASVERAIGIDEQGLIGATNESDRLEQLPSLQMARRDDRGTIGSEA